MKTRCFIIIAILIIVAAVAICVIVNRPVMAPAGPSPSNEGAVVQDQPAITANEALAVAQNSVCVKDGITINEAGEIFYNPNSKTWWFDLKANKEGCSPACVVAADKTAEINWRCTGLKIPAEK